MTTTDTVTAAITEYLDEAEHAGEAPFDTVEELVEDIALYVSIVIGTDYDEDQFLAALRTDTFATRITRHYTI